MDRYGVCVIDNLLGEARGNAILKEVQMMPSGAFTDGQLVKGSGKTEGPSASQLIRGDKITWVDGSEPHCRNIAVLMKLLDNLVIGANSIVTSGQLGGYNIKERSKVNTNHQVINIFNPIDSGLRCFGVIFTVHLFCRQWSHATPAVAHIM